VSGGFSRALNLQQAKVQLNALGITGKKLQSVIATTTKAVDGTQFTMAEGLKATIPVANKLKGTQLDKYLKNIQGASSLTGRSMDELGVSMFASVENLGKLTTMDFKQMTMAGIPVMSALQKSLGKSSAEIQNMISKGDISAKMFRDSLYPSMEKVAGSANKTFSGSLTNLHSAMSKTIEPIAAQIINKLIPAFNQLRQWINQNRQPISDFITKVGASIFNFAKSLVPAIVNIYKFVSSGFGKFILSVTAGIVAATMLFKNFISPAMSFFNAFKNGSNIVKSVGNGISNTVKSISTSIQNFVAGIFNIAKQVINSTGQLFTALKGLVTKIGSFLQTAIKTVGSVINTFLQTIQGVIGNVGGVINSVINVIISALRTLMMGLISLGALAMNPMLYAGMLGVIAVVGALRLAFMLIKPVIDGLIDSLSKLVNNVIVPLFQGIVMPVINKIIEMIPALVNTIVSGFVTISNQIMKIMNFLKNFNFYQLFYNIGKNIPLGLYNGLKSFMSAVLTNIKQIPTKIKNVFAGSSQWLVAAGKNIIFGLWNGIQNAFTSTIAKIQNLISSMSNAVKKVLGIKSPSKVFFGIGQNVTDGLYLGIEKQIPALKKILGNVSSSMLAVDLSIPSSANLSHTLPIRNQSFAWQPPSDLRLATATKQQVVNYNVYGGYVSPRQEVINAIKTVKGIR
jgi:tape measure domain-containing protein